MAQRIQHFSVSVPANTAQAAPQTTATTFNDGTVKALTFHVPPGPSGLVGWRVLYGPQIVIPFSGTAFFVMDDVRDTWELEDFPTGQQWQVQAYNTDIYAHTLQFTFYIDEFTQPSTVSSALLALG